MQAWHYHQMLGINHQVDLGVLQHDCHPPPHPSQWSRNWPSYQQRRDRWAVAYKASAEQSEAGLYLEDRKVLKEVEKERILSM